MNIVLIGYRASGKTSVGRRIAELLGRSFYDSDELIESRTGKTIPSIVAEGGWPAFRAIEKEYIRALSGMDEAIIAVGGGAVLDPENVEVLKSNGRVVWLNASAETIRERLIRDKAGLANRPALTGAGTLEEIGPVMEERNAAYRAAADLVIDVSSRTVETLAREIAGIEKSGGV